MLVSVPCKLSDDQLNFVLSLPDDLGPLTEALNCFDEDAWSEWVPLTHEVAGWSSHVLEHHGSEAAFCAELMVLMANAAELAVGELGVGDLLRLTDPLYRFHRI